MNLGEQALRAVWQYAGFFLIVLFCSEEFRRLLARFYALIRQNPRGKILCYPLAALLFLVAAVLIANSILTLFGTVLFSYD